MDVHSNNSLVSYLMRLNQFLYTGGNLGFSFLHDIQQLIVNFIFLVFCVVWKFLNRRAGPRCFIPLVVENIFIGASTTTTFNQRITWPWCATKITITDTKTGDEFQKTADTFPERFTFSFTKFTIRFIEKSKPIQQINQNFCFWMCSEDIQDFKRGLE